MKIGKILSDAITVFGSTVLFFIFFEIIFGLVYCIDHGKSMRPPIFGGQSLVKNINSDSYDFSPLSIFVNKDGRRHEGLYAKHNVKLPNESGKYRVFIIGGSTVANERKPVGDRISDHIQITLSKLGVDAEVFNFGVANYTSLNELYLALSTLIYLQPDLIIAYDGVNDAFYGALLKAEHWRPNATDLTINYKARMDRDFDMSPIQRLKYFMESSSYTFYYVLKLAASGKSAHVDEMTPAAFSDMVNQDTENRIATPPKVYASRMRRAEIYSDRAKYNAQSIKIYLNNIGFMAAALDAADISFLHVIQPTALTKKKLYPREQWSIEFNNAYYADFQDIMIRAFHEFQIGQRELAGRSTYRRARFLDLSGLTDSLDEYLYDDYCHEYKDGRLTAIVGKAIGEHVKDVFDIPVKRPLTAH